MDGILGFLDCIVAAVGGYASLGFYGTVGKLGGSIGITSFDRSAKVPSGMAEVDMNEQKYRRYLSAEKNFMLYCHM